MPMDVEVLSEQRCHGGVQGSYRHQSSNCGGMQFSVFMPPQAAAGPVPVLYFLAGLTCNEETFMIKAGAQRLAASLGMALVAPDTSPRATGIAEATVDWEFGEGAGFYLDASEAPYSDRFRMHHYVAHELPEVVAGRFAIDRERSGICGHSMGGHGALTIALRYPGQYRSVSAFAPIVAPSEVPWGIKAFNRYLGPDRNLWARYDASLLVAERGIAGEILIDQGLADRFLESQLQPDRFEAACARSGQLLNLRRHAGYDHSYWFIQSFIDDHLRHHHRACTR